MSCFQSNITMCTMCAVITVIIYRDMFTVYGSISSMSKEIEVSPKWQLYRRGQKPLSVKGTRHLSKTFCPISVGPFIMKCSHSGLQLVCSCCTQMMHENGNLQKWTCYQVYRGEIRSDQNTICKFQITINNRKLHDSAFI